MLIWGSILGVAVYACFTHRRTLYWTGDFNGDYRLYSRVGVFRHWCAGELLRDAHRYGFRPVFGFAFGMGGLGAAVLGLIADHTSIYLVIKSVLSCRFWGLLTIFLPDNRHKA